MAFIYREEITNNERSYIYYIMINGIYQALYELLATHIYGGIENLTNSQILVNTTTATIGCLFVEAIPFIVVYFVIKLICSAFNKFFA